MLGQKIQVHEVHMAADPPTRFMIAGQCAQPGRRTITPGHFLTLRAIAAVQIARQRVMAWALVDGFRDFRVARPDGNRETVAEPREAVQIRIRGAERVTYRLNAERRFSGVDHGDGRARVHGMGGCLSCEE